MPFGVVVVSLWRWAVTAVVFVGVSWLAVACVIDLLGRAGRLMVRVSRWLDREGF